MDPIQSPHTDIPSQTDSRFWDRVVLQASHAEPAVKHAILALGSYHNSTMQGNASEITRHHLRYADEQYLKALGEAKLLVANASPRQIERVLIVCILFILYEGMKGNYAVSQAHMDNARAIAAQSRKNQKPALLRTRLTEVGDTLARMDILALTFSETTAPYRYTLDDLLGTGPDLYPTEFSDLTQATASLIDIVRWMLVSGYDYVAEKLPGNTPWSSIVETEVDVRRERLRCWKRHWDQLMLAQPDLRDALSTLNVELWYSFAKINLDAGLIDSEMRFDRSMDEFKHVVELGDAVSSAIAEQRDVASFGLDIGFIFPMFFAIIRCRDPQLRRTMIEQLQRHRRRESTWESVAAAGVAQKWMEVEEEGLDSIESAADVPEGHRMSMLDIKVNVETGTASLHFHSSFRDHVVNDFPLGLTTMDP